MIEFENQELNSALNTFIDRILLILGEKVEMIVLYGSIAYEDVAPNYGDLDFHCLLNGNLTDKEIEELFEYRDKLKGSNNIYLKMLEGEFAPMSLCKENRYEKVAYWGTSRVKVVDQITVRTFSLMGLIKRGIVIFGKDLRSEYKVPTRQVMIDDVYHMISVVRRHAQATNEGIHSIDWLFLISQSIYWVINGDVTCKSKAAEWVYGQEFSNWINYLPKAIELRRNPLLADLPNNREWLKNLGPIIQGACNDLERLIMKKTNNE